MAAWSCCWGDLTGASSSPKGPWDRKLNMMADDGDDGDEKRTDGRLQSPQRAHTPSCRRQLLRAAASDAMRLFGCVLDAMGRCKGVTIRPSIQRNDARSVLPFAIVVRCPQSRIGRGPCLFAGPAAERPCDPQPSSSAHSYPMRSIDRPTEERGTAWIRTRPRQPECISGGVHCTRYEDGHTRTHQQQPLRPLLPSLLAEQR